MDRGLWGWYDSDGAMGIFSGERKGEGNGEDAKVAGAGMAILAVLTDARR